MERYFSNLNNTAGNTILLDDLLAPTLPEPLPRHHGPVDAAGMQVSLVPWSLTQRLVELELQDEAHQIPREGLGFKNQKRLTRGCTFPQENAQFYSLVQFHIKAHSHTAWHGTIVGDRSKSILAYTKHFIGNSNSFFSCYGLLDQSFLWSPRPLNDTLDESVPRYRPNNPDDPTE